MDQSATTPSRSQHPTPTQDLTRPPSKYSPANRGRHSKFIRHLRRFHFPRINIPSVSRRLSPHEPPTTGLFVYAIKISSNVNLPTRNARHPSTSGEHDAIAGCVMLDNHLSLRPLGLLEQTLRRFRQTSAMRSTRRPTDRPLRSSEFFSATNGHATLLALNAESRIRVGGRVPDLRFGMAR